MAIARVSRLLSVPLALALALLLLAGVVPQPVRAATLTVAPSGVDSPTCGTAVPCKTITYALTYRASDGDTISVAAGMYPEADIVVGKSVTIVGAGASVTILDAGSTTRRGFYINSGVTVTISGFTVQGGKTVDPGGGIANLGMLTLINSTITNNSALTGGGIQNDGTLTVTNSTFAGNHADGTSGYGGGIRSGSASGMVTVTNSIFTGNTASFGGGIHNGGGTLTVTNSTFSGNTAAVLGGGIRGSSSTVTVTNSTFAGNHADQGGGGIDNGDGTLTVTNSTFSGNTTNSYGGAIYSGGMRSLAVTVTNSTFSGNTADSVGGAIYSVVGTLTVTNSTLSGNHADGGSGAGGGIYHGSGSSFTMTTINTLIAGNTATGSNGPDVFGPFATASKNNLLGDGTGATGISDGSNGNLVGTTVSPINPLLDTTLRDNGTANGTRTLALQAGSPAINAGDDATCANTTGTAPVAGKDQRGIARPQPSGGRCDIGAFEYVFPATTTALTSGPNPSTTGQAVTFTATVSGGGGTPTGSVTFKDGAAVIGGGTLFSGVASFTTAGLATGSHAITAVYSGDAISPPNTSAVLTQVVNTAGGPPPTTTTVVSSANPSTVGQSVTFTAAVSGSGGTPTGTVTFKDGATTLGTGTLAGGGATFSTATLAQGSHPIAAVYSGDATFATSTSPVVTQVVNAGGPPPSSGLQYYPLAKPVRLLDTRKGATAFVAPGAPLTAGQTLALPGRFAYNGVAIPDAAQAIVGNATVANGANGTPAGFATIFPSGVPLPLTSNLNFVPGTVRPNAFTVALGADGKFDLYSSSGGDFVVDISGYYAPVGAGGLYFHPLSAPVRELDTRAGATAFVHPNATLAAGQTLALPGAFTFSGISVPPSAQALVGNATVANGGNGTPAGFATLFPDDVPLPLASNLNFVPGTVAPNAFVVGVGGGGGYKLYSSAGGDFVVDITGYLDTTAAGGLLFTPLSAPVRELDTRSGATAFVHPNATLTAGQTLTLPGSFTFNGATVPTGAQALVGNATVANDGNATPAGYATLYPDGVALPLASNLNFVPKQVAPNAIAVGVGADGKYDLYSSSGGDFVIDITGYFAAPGAAGVPAKAPATKPTG